VSASQVRHAVDSSWSPFSSHQVAFCITGSLSVGKSDADVHSSFSFFHTLKCIYSYQLSEMRLHTLYPCLRNWSELPSSSCKPRTLNSSSLA
jgi:hypothetical protein